MHRTKKKKEQEKEITIEKPFRNKSFNNVLNHTNP